ncbi:Trans-cinnamate 4-monooxygenase [Sesamum angolense]|uniref:Trans-cinnamate 4-monooxygenase n=1 Tax=Sesamum angolense TaxID=2727404 RepID=A0AAE2C4I2_9LAMI|nr:Trans-cinnamate 4-monooxygenase [Sesamum angolense]
MTVLSPGVQVTEPDTHKLPYLEAVIKETLRFRMVVPWFVTLNNAKLGGYDIPARSRVLENAWMHVAKTPAHWKSSGPKDSLKRSLELKPMAMT